MVERVTITIDEAALGAIDAFMDERGYTNRSEAMRDLLRQALSARAARHMHAHHCAATVSYIYDFGERELASRIARIIHDHHDVVASSVRTPLDHHHSLEVVTLKGHTADVLAIADAIVSERGVKFGQVNAIPLDSHGHDHAHDHDGHHHVHLSPAL